MCVYYAPMQGDTPLLLAATQRFSRSPALLQAERLGGAALARADVGVTAAGQRRAASDEQASCGERRAGAVQVTQRGEARLLGAGRGAAPVRSEGVPLLRECTAEAGCRRPDALGPAGESAACPRELCSGAAERRARGERAAPGLREGGRWG